MLLSRDFSRFARLVLSRRLDANSTPCRRRAVAAAPRPTRAAERLPIQSMGLTELRPKPSRRPIHWMIRIERPPIEPNGETGGLSIVGWGVGISAGRVNAANRRIRHHPPADFDSCYAGCSARAASGDATAAPRKVMNSRRSNLSNCIRSPPARAELQNIVLSANS